MDYQRNLDREIERLPQRPIPESAKSAILNFISDMRLEGLSAGRLYAYTLRLRTIAVSLQERFVNPTESDVKGFISGYMSHSTTWGSGKPHTPTENAVQAYQVTFKRFYKWLLGHNEDYPECVRWIKIKTPHRSKQKKPETVISEIEIKKMIDVCMNMRDKALISLLYDSGCRISEILTMNLKDVFYDQFGAKITVSGKTGVRVVRIVGDSVIYLRDWLKVHPDPDNLEAPLLTRLDGKVTERMDYEQVHALFRKIAKRAGFSRRIYPHLLRHTRASLLALNLKEPLLEKTMGWVHGSRMSQVYVHLDDSDVDAAILRSHGFKTEETNPELPKPKICNRCNEPNPSTATYCRKCWLPFDLKTALDQEKRVTTMTEALTVSPEVDPVIKTVLENMPEDTKLKLLESVLLGLQKQKTTK